MAGGGLEFLFPRVKCCSSVLLKSKVRPSLAPQRLSSSAVCCSISQFSSREELATSWQISSAYPYRPRCSPLVPWLKMGWMKSIKRIGEIGDPWGSPAGTWKVRLVWSSSRKLAVRLLVKLEIQRTSSGGQPWAWSRRIRRPGRTASKAPCISRVSIEALRPRAHASSMSWIRAVVRSVADRSGRAPNCWGWRTLYLMDVHASRRARSRSRPFPNTVRSVINL